MLHFNSHAHVERDDFLRYAIGKIKISTHTLTWSVTRADFPRLAEWIISTHTLTWSVTYPPSSISNCKCISTHTLTWSVTLSTVSSSIFNRNFNSHAHVERDGTDLMSNYGSYISTHTLTWSVT